MRPSRAPWMSRRARSSVGTPDDAHDYGVLDEIARRTFLNGGRVVAVRRSDVPDGAQLAAILRYAV